MIVIGLNMCGKEGYTRSGAEKIRKRIYFFRGKRLRIYKCDRCFEYHLTSETKNKLTLDNF